MGYRGRDIEISMLDNELCLVLACDSCGAIGEKEFDLLNAPASLVGCLTARVALLEVICTGALPRAMTIAVCAEPEPTGEGIIEGVKKELTRFDLDHLPRVISTEKNFATSQTGLGIGVTGTCSIKDLKVARSQPGDHVYCLGLPKVGGEIEAADHAHIIGADQIRLLLSRSDIHDIVPVGSRGILAETNDLAQNTNLRFRLNPSLSLDVQKSAGPSTCIIFTSLTELDNDFFGTLPLIKTGVFDPVSTGTTGHQSQRP